LFANSRATAGASGRPRLRDGPRASVASGGSPAARVSRRVSAKGVADQGQTSHVVQPLVLHMGCLPLARSETARRRDGIPASPSHCGRPAHLVCPLILVRARCVPVPTGLTPTSPGSSYVASPTSRKGTYANADTHAMAQAPPLTPLIRRRGQPGVRQRGSAGRPPVTGRAKSVPDPAVTDGAQRGARGTPTVTPRRRPRPIFAGQTAHLQRGGSRIRILEGISRRIYSPSLCAFRRPFTWYLNEGLTPGARRPSTGPRRCSGADDATSPHP
jgi:hypothetical protein